MLNIDIPPDQALQEAVRVSRKIARGWQRLREVGEISSGVTPKEEVYREDKLVLYRYQPQTRAKPPTTPLLIVYALVNRPYMTDLQEDRSLVRGLLDAGLDVYLIDWGYPDKADRYLDLDDYINGYLDRCVDAVRRRHGLDAIDLLGICQGGTFSLCYSALHPEKVRRLITMVTPVDFHTPNDMLSHQVRHVDVDAAVAAFGNVPGSLLNWSFLMLKPFRLTGQKYVDLLEIVDDAHKLKNFLRMEKWIFDSPDQAGEAFRQFMKECYQQNKLVKGELAIGECRVDLKTLQLPILNIYARDDHLVPRAASVALKNCVGSRDYTELVFPGGHIGIYVSAQAQKLVPPAIGAWIAERSGDGKKIRAKPAARPTRNRAPP